MDVNLTPDESLGHLFFHCCFRDGKITENEIDVVSEKLVAVALNRELNIKEEIIRYQSYRTEIKDEAAYIDHLVTQIHPTNELALFSFCIELCLGDGVIQAEEEALLHTIAAALELDDTTQRTCMQLMVQRKVVETDKVI